AAINRNLNAMGAGDRAQVLACDWRAALDRLAGQRFTLVFLDPPYRMAGVYGQALSALAGAHLLEPGAAVVAESARGAAPILPPDFAVVTSRAYGHTAVTVAEYRLEGAPC
ncbi:MAG: 16S rRNA (guanine(966)-N(2))-methyltransferase RsmD, partial [Clostridiales bacterium]|nr:16S rRNA (guanine(966)-N(2))-methyltransferase RsmD [Clostridiales bacterium]